MINKPLNNYILKDVHNKDVNYNKILSKSKGDGNMNTTIKKVLSIACIFIGLILVGTVSTNIYAKFKWDAEFKEFQNRPLLEAKGTLNEAKNSDYAEVINMDYITQDGISVKVDSLLITDDCFDANINFKFADDIIVNSETFAYGYAIYDENKNLYGILTRMHLGSNEKYDKTTPFIYEEIGIKYNKNDIYAVQLADSLCTSLIETNESERSITTSLTLKASNKNFPKSKKIYIRIFDLGYPMIETDSSTRQAINMEDFKLSKAEWVFEIDIPEKFYNRETLELKLANDIPNFEVTKITLTESGLVLKFKSKQYMDLISNGKDMKGNEFAEARETMLNITDIDGNIYQDIGGGTTGEPNEFKMSIDAGKKDLDKKLFLNYTVDGKKYTSELIKK